MTLGQFLESCSQNNAILIFFFTALLLTSFLAGIFGKGEGHKSPWKYLYATLVYFACIPGIFVIILDLYLLFFEKQSILDANIYTQILPILVMFAALFIIKRNVAFDDIPGFDKIGSLAIILIILISLFWVLEKTHIVVFTYIPFSLFILLFIAVLVVLRFLLKRFMA